MHTPEKLKRKGETEKTAQSAQISRLFFTTSLQEAGSGLGGQVHLLFPHVSNSCAGRQQRIRNLNGKLHGQSAAHLIQTNSKSSSVAHAYCHLDKLLVSGRLQTSCPAKPWADQIPLLVIFFFLSSGCLGQSMALLCRSVRLHSRGNTSQCLGLQL